MSADIERFSQWLNEKLKEFNTDESVFGSYINGILEGDESVDEKREALEGILSEIIVSYQAHYLCPCFEDRNANHKFLLTTKRSNKCHI